MRLATILVAMDFSPLSFAAARRACSLVEEGGKVRLLHVVPNELGAHAFVDPALIERFYAGRVADAEIRLGDLAHELRGKADIERSIVRGRPADEIVVAGRGFDLIVVGAHGREVAEAVGSVAGEVARRSATPTLIIRQGEPRHVKRVLLAVDVTEPAPEAHEAAAALAHRLGASLEAIHVVPLPARMPGDKTEPALDELDAAIRERAPAALRAALADAIGHVNAIHVGWGQPAEETARHATVFDVIVCGTHQRSALLEHLPFGSVAMKLSRLAPCPVLVVRRRGGTVLVSSSAEARALAKTR
ncbi:MAG TPA: universal stress protein [Planctomycetota bacterium]|nr:universal stress protein [Planctomycetota bacterium]